MALRRTQEDFRGWQANMAGEQRTVVQYNMPCTSSSPQRRAASKRPSNSKDTMKKMELDAKGKGRQAMKAVAQKGQEEINKAGVKGSGQAANRGSRQKGKEVMKRSWDQVVGQHEIKNVRMDPYVVFDTPVAKKLKALINQQNREVDAKYKWHNVNKTVLQQRGQEDIKHENHFKASELGYKEPQKTLEEQFPMYRQVEQQEIYGFLERHYHCYSPTVQEQDLYERHLQSAQKLQYQQNNAYARFKSDAQNYPALSNRKYIEYLQVAAVLLKKQKEVCESFLAEITWLRKRQEYIWLEQQKQSMQQQLLDIDNMNPSQQLLASQYLAPAQYVLGNEQRQPSQQLLANQQMPLCQQTQFGMAYQQVMQPQQQQYDQLHQQPNVPTLPTQQQDCPRQAIVAQADDSFQFYDGDCMNKFDGTLSAEQLDGIQNVDGSLRSLLYNIIADTNINVKEQQEKLSMQCKQQSPQVPNQPPQCQNDPIQSEVGQADDSFQFSDISILNDSAGVLTPEELACIKHADGSFHSLIPDIVYDSQTDYPKQLQQDLQQHHHHQATQKLEQPPQQQHESSQQSSDQSNDCVDWSFDLSIFEQVDQSLDF